MMLQHPSDTRDGSAAAVHPAANLRRIGGEMLAWSDWDTARGPGVAPSAALRLLVTDLLAESPPASRTVLAAGPHDDGMIAELLAGGASVTCLVRSLGDAERLAATFPSVTVLCGNVTKLDPASRYAVVSAVAGVDRLISVEGDQTSSADVLRVLAGVLRPGGALVLMHDNPLGVHHLVELDPGRHHANDSSWQVAPEHDDLRPASPDQIEEQLAGEGLSLAGLYAVYPTPHAPRVLINREMLGGPGSPLRGQISTVLAQSCADAFRSTPVLSDPRRLLRRAIRAGSEVTLAPGWLTVARPGAADPEPARALVVCDPDGSYAYELSAVDGRPRVNVKLVPEVPTERAGLRRVTDPSAAYQPFGGQLFDERLLTLCARGDLSGLRGEVHRFVGWLDGHAQDGTITGPVALATIGTVLDTGEAFLLAPPRWEPVAPVPVNTAVVRALWTFAIQLITWHHPHPWSITSSAADLTTVLLAMVGRTATEDEFRAAVDLQVAYDTADEGLSFSAQHNRRLELLAVQPGAVAIDVSGYRELTEALWRQRYQVSHLLAMMEWTEQMIRSRDLALSKADWEIQLLRKNWFGKLIALARIAYRVSRRDLRKAAHKLHAYRKDQGLRSEQDINSDGKDQV